MMQLSELDGLYLANAQGQLVKCLLKLSNRSFVLLTRASFVLENL
jgi:hypothetical protein